MQIPEFAVVILKRGKKKTTLPYIYGIAVILRMKLPVFGLSVGLFRDEVVSSPMAQPLGTVASLHSYQ